MAGRRADAHGTGVLPPRRGHHGATPAPGQRALHTIQTNGTLLDEAWAEFFAEHDFLVGVSIDGPREIHDTYRVTKGHRGSFEKVMRVLRHLRDADVQWTALTTIHAANAERGRDVYRFLRDECDARFIQFIPIIERVAEAIKDGTARWASWRDCPLYVQQGDVVTARSVTAEQYGQFLTADLPRVPGADLGGACASASGRDARRRGRGRDGGGHHRQRGRHARPTLDHRQRAEHTALHRGRDADDAVPRRGRQRAPPVAASWPNRMRGSRRRG